MEKYAYTLYGKPAAASTVGNPYMYTGRRLDAETGLYYYRARYYDPHLRRFIETDPIGYAGGMNLYAYVGNSPVNFVDPYGLINILKTGVGIINVKRGIVAGAKGTANLIIATVSVGSGAGWPLGAFETIATGYYLGIACPGFMVRGVQQVTEGIKENEGELSLGHWKNLRGIGPLGQFVDDPDETYADAIKMKRERGKDAWNTLKTKPIEGAKKVWRWLIDWTV